MRTLSLALLTAFLGICVVLMATNPTTDEHLIFLETILSQALERLARTVRSREQNLLRSVFRAQGRRLIEGVKRLNTLRRNWGVASLFETRVLDGEVVVLGVAARFVPINGVEEATPELGCAELWVDSSCQITNCQSKPHPKVYPSALWITP